MYTIQLELKVTAISDNSIYKSNRADPILSIIHKTNKTFFLNTYPTLTVTKMKISQLPTLQNLVVFLSFLVVHDLPKIKITFLVTNKWTECSQLIGITNDLLAASGLVN